MAVFSGYDIHANAGHKIYRCTVTCGQLTVKFWLLENLDLSDKDIMKGVD